MAHTRRKFTGALKARQKPGGPPFQDPPAFPVPMRQPAHHALRRAAGVEPRRRALTF